MVIAIPITKRGCRTGWSILWAHCRNPTPSLARDCAHGAWKKIRVNSSGGASTSVAHDFYSNVIRAGKVTTPAEEVRVARFTAVALGAGAVFVAILLGPGANVAFLVGLAFAVAASANLPAIVLSLFWRRFNTAGAVSGMAAAILSG
jgi:Na+/pantothenate symporter